MLAICSWNRYSVVLDCDIQYWSGEGTFSGRRSPRDHFEFKYWRGRRGRSSQPDDRPQVSCEHTTLLEDTTLTPSIYILLYTKVGLFISFSGCLGLLAGVCRFWRVFGGVGGPLSLPTCFRFRHVNQTCVCV